MLCTTVYSFSLVLLAIVACQGQEVFELWKSTKSLNKRSELVSKCRHKNKLLQDFIHKALAGSAPAWMGYRTSYIKTAHVSSGNSLSSFNWFGRRVLYHRNGVWLKGIWIPKEMQSKGITNVRPIFLINVEGKIFFWVLAHRMTTFLMRNHYINTSIQKAWIPGFSRCLEHSQMIWNTIFSAKRDKAEQHVIWLDLANAYGSVPHYLIRIAVDFFNFPNKV